MRAMVVARYGPPEVFEPRDLPVPTLKPYEALIRVYAVGVGFADLMQRMGVYLDTLKPPFVPGFEGFEVAGVIEQGPASSPDGKPLQVGERVAALAKFAAYAERVAVPAQRIFRLPAGVSFEDAAAIPLNYLTAHHIMFVMGNLQPGGRILIHGAAGGVGGAAVQLAKARDLKVFGTAGPAKQEFLRRTGVDHAIDYTREDFVEVVRRAAPEGIEMVMDPIGGNSFSKSYRCLGPMGRLAIYGFSAAAGPEGKRSLLRAAKTFIATRRYHPLKLMEGLPARSSLLPPLLRRDSLPYRISHSKQFRIAGTINNDSAPHLARGYDLESMIRAVGRSGYLMPCSRRPSRGAVRPFTSITTLSPGGRADR